MRFVGSFGAALVALVACSAACSSEGGESQFQKRPTKADGGTSLPGDTPVLGDDPRTPGGSVDPTSACATSTAKAEGAPLYLVFMVDKSGSMDDDGKWTSTVSALKSFFGDATMNGISASLHVFPATSGLECSSAGYATPLVAMTALPSPAFGTRLDGITPDGSTPTKPALEGALAYAKQVGAQHPDGKVAVVLATDGDPTGCGSSVTTVSTVASGAAATVPTYVIGVGASLTSLNQVAQSGGTKQALIVSTTAPAQIAADFAKAVEGIRQKAISCDYKIPAPPSGQSFDVGKVNVRYTDAAGAGATLTYSKDCATGQGWRYDNADRPTKIEICPGSCNSIKADTKAKLDILFGCATQGGVIR